MDYGWLTMILDRCIWLMNQRIKSSMYTMAG
jgi:hypothetical protein